LFLADVVVQVCRFGTRDGVALKKQFVRQHRSRRNKGAKSGELEMASWTKEREKARQLPRFKFHKKNSAREVKNLKILFDNVDLDEQGSQHPLSSSHLALQVSLGRVPAPAEKVHGPFPPAGW
jgi:hypothetical protein